MGNNLFDIEQLWIGLICELLSEYIFPLLHCVIGSLLHAAHRYLVIDMRVEGLHAKEP